MKSSWFAIFVLATAALLRTSETRPDDGNEAASRANDSMLGKEAGQVRNDNGLKMKLVWCPAGQFKMGSPESELEGKNEGPQVEVTITRGFWVGQFELTQGLWESLMGTTPWKGKDGVQEGDDFPATFVNWDDAVQFCDSLTDRERKAGRLAKGWAYVLPTEAQWEYACRAGTTTRFSFGDDALELGDYAWFGRFYGEDGKQAILDELYAHEVGLKKPNPRGLNGYARQLLGVVSGLVSS